MQPVIVFEQWTIKIRLNILSYYKDFLMSYLEEFKAQIQNRDFSKFLQLWEEYCTSDTVETEEFVALLKALKQSDFIKLFGPFVETALPLWKTIQNEEESYEVLKHLIDLETTQSALLAETALAALKKRYGHQPQFAERLRLIGMRNMENFQGALANYDLLNHMEKGKFVFHTGGWGIGEIVDVSAVREQLGVEFENVAGRKHITFANAFKTLIPLPDDNFLARRFADPDLLEKEATEDPIAVLKVLLRDLGPKSASEIKDELCELVIAEGNWIKWWQSARSKLKKDTMVETPESIKAPFRLRKSAVTHEERLHKAIHNKTDIDEVILTSYNFVRDLPSMLKKSEVKDSLKAKLLAILDNAGLTKAQELQLLILLDTYFGHSVAGKPLAGYVADLPDVENVIRAVDILAFKKRALTLVRENRADWPAIFLSFLGGVAPSAIKDYVLKELNQGSAKALLLKQLEELIRHPAKDPELMVWYFQKLVSKSNQELPFADKQGQCQFFEALLILLSAIETKAEYKDLVKKIYLLLSGKRYLVVRNIIEGTDIEFLKEFLLLVAKCHSLSDHDVKILRSLAEVVHPSLAAPKSKKGGHHDGHLIWTTEPGYLKTQERARQLGTVEIVENAKEIEAARALGDLRENSEYKFALEKRSQLQSELKTLSDQLSRARLITRDDISADEVGIGAVVELKDSNDKQITYTILGPWDADVDAHILSFQSKFAQAMTGLGIGDKFKFRDEEYTVVALKSYLDK